MEIHKNMTSGAYCRLCAHYDQINTLINLNVDKEKYEEITSTLSLLNATYVDLSKNNKLHLTICADCYYFLSKTQEFLCKVKNAQHTLTSLSLSEEDKLPNDKIFTKEESTDEFCYASIEICSTAIKTEIDDCHFSEPEVEFDFEHSPCDFKNPFEFEIIVDGNSIVKEENDDKTQKPTAKENETAFPLKLLERVANKTLSKSINPLFHKTSNKKSTDLPAISKVQRNSKTTKCQVVKCDNQVSKSEPSLHTILGNKEPNNQDTRSKNIYKTLHQNTDLIKNVHETFSQNTNLSTNISEVFNQNTKISKNIDAPSNQITNSSKFYTNDSDDNFEDIPDLEFDIITKRFTCEICNQNFSRKEHKYRHRIKVHKVVPRKRKRKIYTVEDLTCKYCKKVYASLQGLTNHIQLKHTQNQEIYICDHCGKEFHGKKKFNVHIVSHRVKTHICRICNDSFLRRSQLATHVRRHLNATQFECDHCGSRFVTKKDITDHMRVHSDLKPFKCNICQKTFKRNSNLKNHMRVHNNDSRYECKPCKMRFSCWGNCNKHMKRKHNTTLRKGNKEMALKTKGGTSNMGLEEWKKDVLVSKKTRKI